MLKGKFTCGVVVVISALLVLISLANAYTSQPRYYRSAAGGEDGVERVIELVPSSVTVRPRHRQRISSNFAKQYWVSGNFFNRDNFKAIPTLTERGSDGVYTASPSFPRPLILSSKGRIVPVIAAFEETPQEL